MLGAFNIEGIQACLRKVCLIIENLGDKHFSLLNIILQLLGATPEAYDEVNEFSHSLHSRNITALAVVIISPAILSIISTYIDCGEHKKLSYLPMSWTRLIG